MKADALNFSNQMVEDIRIKSRELVRAWGFMGGNFAGTELSPSAVHALIEIEKGEMTARDLGERLQLEKSSVSRMLRKLIDSGEIAEAAATGDGRSKVLSLTKAGRRRVTAIHNFAQTQVAAALKRLTPGGVHTVLEGLRLYTEALSPAVKEVAQTPNIEIARGYRTGLIARVTQMHMKYYARESGFGQQFESLVAGGLAEFCNRMEHPKNALWTALRDNDIVGSVAVDGEDIGDGIAHLRWFIVDDTSRGGGVGRKLLTKALAFVDAKGFSETQLSTFSGLTTARHLYESLGFVCTEERPGNQWGKTVMEQKFSRPHP